MVRSVGHMWCPAGALLSLTTAAPAPWEMGAPATHVASYVKKHAAKNYSKNAWKPELLLLRGKP